MKTKLGKILDDTVFYYNNESYELDYSIAPGENRVCIKNLVTNECLVLPDTTEVDIRNKKVKLVWPGNLND